MSKPKVRRLSFELAIGYLLPFPALVGGMVWTLALLTISYAAATHDGIALQQEVLGQSSGLSTLGNLLFAASVMLGLLPAILRLSSGAEEWDLRQLSPPVSGRERRLEEKRMLREQAPSRASMLVATAVGLVTAVLVVRWIIGSEWNSLRTPSLAWMALEMGLLFQMLFRGIATTWWVRQRRAPLFRAAEKVDLLDLTPQHTVARMALRSSMTHLAGAALTSLFLLAGGTALTTTIMALATVFALLTLLPPILRLQAAIRSAKNAAIQEVQAQLQGLREQAATVAPGRMADALSYLDYLERLPILPFDKGRVAVASLYFAVPLASWLWVSAIQGLFRLSS